MINRIQIKSRLILLLIGAQGLGRSAASPAISVPRMQLPALPQDEATRILVTRNQFLNRFYWGEADLQVLLEPIIMLTLTQSIITR